MPDYTENKFVSNPNSNIGGSNLDSMFGSSKSKQSTSKSTSGFKNTSVSEYLRLRALNAPEGAAKEFAMKEYSEFLNTNGQGTPAVANPLAPVTSAATATPAPTTPATPAAPAPAPTPTPPATPAAPSTPAGASKAAPSPCDSIMEDIDRVTKLSRSLESENVPGMSNTIEQELRRRTINEMLRDAHKRMIDCNKLREKERRAPEIKAAKDKMLLDVKNAASNKAFHANAKDFGRKQFDNVMEKTAALLSVGAISFEQYQAMNEDPSTYSDTIDRLWSQNFNQDVGSPEVGHNESQPAPTPAAPVAAVEPPKAPYGQQNSGRYDRFKPEPTFTPPPQPQQPNKPPYGYPTYGYG